MAGGARERTAGDREDSGLMQAFLAGVGGDLLRGGTGGGAGFGGRRSTSTGTSTDLDSPSATVILFDHASCHGALASTLCSPASTGIGVP